MVSEPVAIHDDAKSEFADDDGVPSSIAEGYHPAAVLKAFNGDK
jgi:hypothetical protein